MNKLILTFGLFFYPMCHIGLAQEQPSELLIEVAKDPNSKIVYDEQSGEFQIVIHTRDQSGKSTLTYLPIKFDPFTGKPLVSKRALLFKEPDIDDEYRLIQLLESCSTMSDISKALGKPTRTWPPDADGTKQYDFKNVSSSVGVTVKEAKDGTLETLFVPLATEKEQATAKPNGQ